MVVCQKFKVLSGNRCLTSYQNKVSVVKETAYSNYSPLIQELVKSAEQRIINEVQDIYDVDENYGKEITINISLEVSAH